MKNPDITYSEHGMFTMFMPETDAGKAVWDSMIEETLGTGKILSTFAKSVIKQIRDAGYTVHKATPPTESMEDILKELGL